MLTKTYKGKTAGGILKSAAITKMQAGNVEVLVTIGKRQYVAMQDDNDDLVIADSGGTKARVETSGRAARKLRTLMSAADSAML